VSRVSRGRSGARRGTHALEYALFWVLLAALASLSWDGARRLGHALGSFAFDLLRLRRRVVLENLAHAFPEMSPKERTSLARACYRAFGITFLELFLLPRTPPREVLQRVRFADPEVFARVRAEGRGAVLLSAHLGNWELLGSACAALGHPLTVLVARQRNRRVDERVRAAREAAGMRVLYTDGGLRPVLRALQCGEFVAFLFDQDAGRGGEFAPFLGRPASTPLGPFRFARLAGCPIVMGLSVRRPDGSYTADLPVLCLSRELDAGEAERAALREANRLLEAAVRRYPEQWFWMHRRWKTRPVAPAAPAGVGMGPGEGRHADRELR